MRKTLLILLAGALAISAVEWDIEQVTYEADLWSTDPILVLDAQWHPHILFTQWNEMVHLRVAIVDTEGWFIRDVAEIQGMSYYSFEVDDNGNTFVAFADMVGETTDIFLASDSTGDFVPVNVTDDEAFQAAPVIKLDHEDIPHIIYAEALTPEDEIKISHGWLDTEGFHSQEIVDNMYQEDYLGYELVFDPLHIPHVFYIGDDDHLWHTTSGEPAWIGEQLNDLSSEWPSAVADPLGSFHVAYDAGANEIHYITNMTGAWQDEVVSALGVPEAVNERPSLALETVWGEYLGIGNPHLVWMHADAEGPYDLYYSGKTTGAWSSEEPVTSTPEKDELPGYGHYFAVDVEGYGHLVYCAEDENFVMQVFYAKSTEPLIEGITENPPQSTPLNLKVRGGAVCFSLPQTGSIRLDLYDAAGRRVERLASGNYEAGEHSLPINSTGLAAGVYFLRLESSNSAVSAKMVKTK